MRKYMLIFLCYCIGIYFLYLNPNDVNHKFIFYIFSSIPIGFFCHIMGKACNSHKQLGFVGILLTGVVISLGTLTAYAILINFYKSHKMSFICLVLLFMISMVVLIIWIRKKERRDRKKRRF